MDSIVNKKTSVLFATFAVYIKGKPLHANGMIEPILSFFLPKVKKFTLLIQPHPGSDRINPIMQIYEGKRKLKETVISSLLYFPLYLLCKIQNKDDMHISFKLRDLFSVLYCGIISKTPYDLFIGLESVNTIAGIILRKLGRVKVVIYYVPDYSPQRFGESIFSKIYNRLDKFCIEHADFTWDVSPYMKRARYKTGIVSKSANKILHVPNGLFTSQINPLPIKKRIPDSIVYMGLLNPDQHGVDLALKAFAIVLKKKPHATFHIIGGTNRDVNPFMELVKQLDIEKSVISHGFVPPNKQMSDIINKCYIGVATYRLDKNPRNRYGDSGKIRQYLGCGLPIVATTIQWYTKYAIDNGAGLGVKETPEDFAKAIMTLFENKKLYKQYSEKAISLSKENTWENSYTNVFSQMQKIMVTKK